MLFLTACTSSYSFFFTFPQYWLKWWTESSGDQTWVYISGYVLLFVLAWIATNIQMWYGDLFAESMCCRNQSADNSPPR